MYAGVSRDFTKPWPAEEFCTEWAIRCSTYQQRWDKTSYRGIPPISGAEGPPKRPNSSRYDLKPDNAILADDKHQSL